jgi:hypothetical protein
MQKQLASRSDLKSGTNYTASIGFAKLIFRKSIDFSEKLRHFNPHKSPLLAKTTPPRQRPNAPNDNL